MKGFQKKRMGGFATAVAMLCAGAAIGMVGSTGAYAADVVARFSVGLGWNLCDVTETVPPLETAFNCSGLVPAYQPREIALEHHVNSEGVEYWDGRYFEETRFEDKKMNVEILITLAPAANEKKYFFIEGRITSVGIAQRTLFRFMAEDLSQLQQTMLIGSSIPVEDPNGKIEVMPVLYIGGK